MGEVRERMEAQLRAEAFDRVPSARQSSLLSTTSPG